MLTQFMRAFGKSTCFLGTPKWGEKWSTISIEEVLTDLDAEEPAEYLLGFITSLVQVIVQREVIVYTCTSYTSYTYMRAIWY
jgi:hypothetical protein